MQDAENCYSQASILPCIFLKITFFICFSVCVCVFINALEFFRFKIHVQAIDNTGSTTFVLFDRVVSQFLGRSVQDLLDRMPNVCSFLYDVDAQFV